MAKQSPKLRAANNPYGTSGGCLFVILVFALVVSAIPFGGVVTFVVGYWLNGWSRSKRGKALEHVRTAPLMNAAEVHPGDEVAIEGRVTGPAEAVKTPLGRKVVVATAWMDNELGDQTEDARPSWSAQFGERIELDAERARLVVTSERINLYSDSVTITKQYDGHVPPHAPLQGAEREALKGKCAEYGERWLDVDHDVVVSAVVEAVTDETPLDGGYRGEGRRRVVSLVAPPGGVVRVTTRTPQRIAQIAREAHAETIGGGIMMGVAVVSLLFWATHCY